MKEKMKKQRKLIFPQRCLSIALLAAFLAVQVAGCGNTQSEAGDSQSESAQSEIETVSEDTESETVETEEASEPATDEAETEESSTLATEESSEPATEEGGSTDTETAAASETGDSESGDEASNSGSSDEAAASESGDSASGSESSDSNETAGSGEETAELTCQLLYEAVAAQAVDGAAMVTAKDECTFLTSKYRELVTEFYYATDPEQVYCVCIVKADSEDSAQTIKAEFDDALMSMQNDMYLTTDEQKVVKAGVTGISGQYVWYISLSDDASVMSAAENALVSKLG